MIRTAWRIATDTPAYEAHDLTGAGAALTGGRWNEKSAALTYAAETRSLACLETIIHLAAGGLPLNRYLVEISIPEALWAAARRETAETLPVGWDATPAGRVSIALGTQWLKTRQTAVLFVPSAIVPEEFCILINPTHPNSARITARKIRRWLYDPRITRSA